MATPPVIHVVNKYKEKEFEYIGRPSPLGNPYHITLLDDRDYVCDMYDLWFLEHLNDKMVKAELNRLLDIAKSKGKLNLGCYCAPKRCHGETIARWLNIQLEEDEEERKYMQQLEDEHIHRILQKHKVIYQSTPRSGGNNPFEQWWKSE